MKEKNDMFFIIEFIFSFMEKLIDHKQMCILTKDFNDSFSLGGHCRDFGQILFF